MNNNKLKLQCIFKSTPPFFCRVFWALKLQLTLSRFYAVADG